MGRRAGPGSRGARRRGCAVGAPRRGGAGLPRRSPRSPAAGGPAGGAGNAGTAGGQARIRDTSPRREATGGQRSPAWRWDSQAGASLQAGQPPRPISSPGAEAEDPRRLVTGWKNERSNLDLPTCCESSVSVFPPCGLRVGWKLDCIVLVMAGPAEPPSRRGERGAQGLFWHFSCLWLAR